MITFDQKCSECGREVEAKYLTCPHCANEKDVKARRLIQIEMIGRAVAGEIELRLYRDDKNVKHIQAWGYELTLCGEETKSQRAKHRRSWLWYGEETEMTKLCPKCVIEFNTLAQEVPRAEA